jgi:transcriptional repressor NrdR
MLCPRCLSPKNRVVDSRLGKNPHTVRRRRYCKNCDLRFTTLEEIQRDEVYVIKRDGRRELFSRDKILKSINRAVEKLSIDPEQAKMLVTAICMEISEKEDKEVPTSTIAEIVMAHLKKFNGVAYIRFASVYKEFQRLEDYESALQELRETDG